MADEKQGDARAEKENVDETLDVSKHETSGPHSEKRTTEEVRQGHTGDHVRYILGISFVGVLVALFALYALQRSENTDDAPNAEAVEREPSQTRIREASAQTEDPGGANGERTRAAAELSRPDGAPAGSVGLEQTPNGVLITATLRGLPPGEHGFHIHETGACKPDFKAAGDHFAPRGNDHGIYAEKGPHAGDMPNIHVGEDGKLKVEALNPRISLKAGAEGYILDNDGSAIIVHRGADDYRSQPSGDAGERIACGVVKGGPG